MNLLKWQLTWRLPALKVIIRNLNVDQWIPEMELHSRSYDYWTESISLPQTFVSGLVMEAAMISEWDSFLSKLQLISAVNVQCCDLTKI